MTDVSPSSKKVDDFLSSLSLLSQERIKEDRQRQRNLQHDIDELRSRLHSSSPIKGESNYMSSSNRSLYQISVPDLKFNRSRLSQEDDFAPPLPRRRDVQEEDEPPALPRRARVEEEETAPRLPTRKHQDSIGLLQPVARKEAPAKPMKPKPVTTKYDKRQLPSSNDVEPSGHRSFRDIESLIRSGKASTKTLESASAELPDPKPKPTKPAWLSSSVKPVSNTKQAPSSSDVTPAKPKPTSWIDSAVSKSPESKPKTNIPLVKPTKPKHLELHQELKPNEPEPEFMTQFQKLKKEKKQPSNDEIRKTPPVVKPKPMMRSMNEPPAEFQAKFNSITKPSPIKPTAKTIKDRKSVV